MHSIFTRFTRTVSFNHDLKSNIYSFLVSNNNPETAEHSIKVGIEARKVAMQFGADPDVAEIAGWLHDISAIFPNHERIAVAKELNIEVFPEEELFPMIIHQKISKFMAQDIFNISDPEILDAVGCHTTLRANSTLLDQVLFVADKISWDQSGEPPYLNNLKLSLEKSLIHGAYSYINYLWERRESLKVMHPWLIEAHVDLKKRLEDSNEESYSNNANANSNWL